MWLRTEQAGLIAVGATFTCLMMFALDGFGLGDAWFAPLLAAIIAVLLLTVLMPALEWVGMVVWGTYTEWQQRGEGNDRE